MHQVGRNQLFELSDQLVNAFRWKVEPEEFDCNEPLPFRVISPKDRAQRSRTNLMKNPKWPELVWRCRAGSFGVQ